MQPHNPEKDKTQDILLVLANEDFLHENQVNEIYKEINKRINPEKNPKEAERVINIIDRLIYYYMNEYEDSSYRITDELDDLSKIELAASTDYLLDDNGREHNATITLNLWERKINYNVDGMSNVVDFNNYHDLFMYVTGATWDSFMEDARKYIKEGLHMENKERLLKEIDAVLSGELDIWKSIMISPHTPKLLQEIGLNDYPILMSQRHVRNCLHEKGKSARWHGLTKEYLSNIEEYLTNPAIIYDSLTGDDSIVVVTDQVDVDLLPIVASIKINGEGQYEFNVISSNYLTSTYGHEHLENILDRAIIGDDVLYVNKEKTQSLEAFSSLQLLGRFSKDFEFNTIIHKSQNIVNENAAINDVLNASSDSIVIDGHIGTWHVVEADSRNGEPVFLLEHEIFGDEAPYLIVDQNRNIIYDDVWNGFDDMYERDEMYNEMLNKYPPFEQMYDEVFSPQAIASDKYCDHIIEYAILLLENDTDKLEFKAEELKQLIGEEDADRVIAKAYIHSKELQSVEPINEESKERIANTILEWVGKNYGSQEAEDPSWDIDSLSEELNKELNLKEPKNEYKRNRR